jgi:hypothetical protein
MTTVDVTTAGTRVLGAPKIRPPYFSRTTCRMSGYRTKSAGSGDVTYEVGNGTLFAVSRELESRAGWRP